MIRVSATLLGRRSTVGHLPLEQVIGVRIPASQPTQIEALNLRELSSQQAFASSTFAVWFLLQLRSSSAFESQRRSTLNQATLPLVHELLAIIVRIATPEHLSARASLEPAVLSGLQDRGL